MGKRKKGTMERARHVMKQHKENMIIREGRHQRDAAARKAKAAVKRATSG